MGVNCQIGNIKSFDMTRQKSFNIKVNWDIDLRSHVIYWVSVILVLLHLCVTLAMIYFSHETLMLCVIATEFFILLVTRNTNRLLTEECVRLTRRPRRSTRISAKIFYLQCAIP